MSWMFEVFYALPRDDERERLITALIAEYAGRLDYHEVVEDQAARNVCLTYEFDERLVAERCAAALRATGAHVEGPNEYGD